MYRKTGLVVFVSVFCVALGASSEDLRLTRETEFETQLVRPLLSSQAALISRLPQPTRDNDFYDSGSPSPALVELGRLLFFDKILSGNLNISCASCHHPFAATADGLSLSVGEGGNGFAVTRSTGEGGDEIPERVPRNAPAVFNLGAREFTRMFHDGRVELMPSHPTGFLSPAGDDLPEGLDNVLAAQAMFPVTSGTEMAGQAGENAQADVAASQDLPAVWLHIADKLRDIPEYVELFIAAYDQHPMYPVTSASDISYVHAANAIAAFETSAWRTDNSPFDRFVRGKYLAVSLHAMIGATKFYGEAGCSSCHSGVFQTDHQFHAIAVPQVGPGKGDGFDGREDFGRERVTGQEIDRYKFRTPTLRNVALTGPWGHDGAFATLEAMVRHHLDAVESLESYDLNQLVVPYRDDLNEHDFVVQTDPVRRAEIAAACELTPSQLSDRDIEYLIEFLYSLTDPKVLDMRADVPQRVPSGLAMWD
ncbi:MAG: cytochrome-c peroxidase [bacterium]|nr:cytochrome-c peroxidase [bacterium]